MLLLYKRQSWKGAADAIPEEASASRRPTVNATSSDLIKWVAHPVRGLCRYTDKNQACMLSVPPMPWAKRAANQHDGLVACAPRLKGPVKTVILFVDPLNAWCQCLAPEVLKIVATDNRHPMQTPYLCLGAHCVMHADCEASDALQVPL